MISMMIKMMISKNEGTRGCLFSPPNDLEIRPSNIQTQPQAQSPLTHKSPIDMSKTWGLNYILPYSGATSAKKVCLETATSCHMMHKHVSIFFILRLLATFLRQAAGREKIFNLSQRQWLKFLRQVTGRSSIWIRSHRKNLWLVVSNCYLSLRLGSNMSCSRSDRSCDKVVVA